MRASARSTRVRTAGPRGDRGNTGGNARVPRCNNAGPSCRQGPAAWGDHAASLRQRLAEVAAAGQLAGSWVRVHLEPVYGQSQGVGGGGGGGTVGEQEMQAGNHLRLATGSARGEGLRATARQMQGALRDLALLTSIDVTVGKEACGIPTAAAPPPPPPRVAIQGHHTCACRPSSQPGKLFCPACSLGVVLLVAPEAPVLGGVLHVGLAAGRAGRQAGRRAGRRDQGERTWAAARRHRAAHHTPSAPASHTLNVAQELCSCLPML